MLRGFKCVIVVSLMALRAETIPRDLLADPGFQHFYSLEYSQALADFTAAAAKNPSSPDAYNHIAQAIMFREITRAGVFESGSITSTNAFLRLPKLKLSAADQEAFSNALKRAAELAKAQLEDNPNDVEALYALGVTYGLRANYDSLFRKTWLDALHDMTSARKLHNKITELDPSFVDAKLIQGLHDYVVGSLPLGWKMLARVAGFHGDRRRGIATLELVYADGHINRIDAAMMLVGIYRREKRPADAIPMLNDLITRLPRNFLLRLELADMYSDLGDDAKALAVLDEVDHLKRTDAPGYQNLSIEKLRIARERVVTRLRATASLLSNIGQ